MNNQIQLIPLSQIIKNRFQLEGVQDKAKVLEIASSLKANRDNGTKGLLQVPTARKINVGNKAGSYELAFGHHRFNAFEQNSLIEGDLFFSEMPLIVRELTDIEMFELMAIENFHRRDIGVLEEANTLHSYMTTFKKTSEEAAAKFEKTPEYVRQSIRLLKLPEPARIMLQDGQLNKSQARDLLVAEKIGGATLVQEILEDIDQRKGNSSTDEIIEDVLRMSQQTIFLDADAGWYTSKKFPVKHLATLSAKDIHDLIEFDLTGYDGILIDDVITDMMTLISAGMEVTDESFPMVTPESLTRLRILVNPPQCEKCPLHAVRNGSHLCGMPQCKKAKVEAWKKKEFEDDIKKTGIPLYQKSDGPKVVLDVYSATDKKLFSEGGADLRLVPTQYKWNNFEGLNQNLEAVVIGDTAAKRLKKLETEGKKGETQESMRLKEAAVREAVRNMLDRFEWEVVAPAFRVLFDGITSYAFLEFLAGNYDEITPGEIEEDKVIAEAKKVKKSDGLNMLRRLIAVKVVEGVHSRHRSFSSVTDAPKPILKYAKDFKEIADEWEVKLPKDFDKQAAECQAELEATIKEIKKS